jgi:hydrogenase maturation protein HypF
VGRLFDAAAALILGVGETSFEGQGPMMLEAAASHTDGRLPRGDESLALPMCRDEAGILRLDWGPWLRALLQAPHDATTSADFHETLAASIAAIAEAQRALTGIERVGLTGGVFQNALLTQLAHALLTRRGFKVLLSEHIPCNDGGLSYGQIIETARRRNLWAER